MPTEPFTTYIGELRGLGGSRVWSLMISLFGDLAQERGQTIDGPILSAIMNVLQVKPEAVRVALHRLRNDGWILSEKSGRISRHSLTDKGHRESAAASPRIYAAPDQGNNDWQLVLTPDAETTTAEAMTMRDFTSLTPRLFVGPAAARPVPDSLSFKGDTAPQWLRAEAAPEDLRASYLALNETLERLKADLPDPGRITPIETAVLRCLIVHNWRRLVLKHPPLPRALVSDGWPGHRCHLLVAELLSLFPRPALADIELSQAA
ncbi:MAG: PaaX family transcriptional regulator [Sulfitobacter sp.]|nr:PaaX family transcriptional regulator [Sulfitobacter sp.]